MSPENEAPAFGLMFPKTVWTAAASPTWQKVELTLDVPESAERLRVGLVVTGAASAGLDDLEISRL